MANSLEANIQQIIASAAAAWAAQIADSVRHALVAELAAPALRPEHEKAKPLVKWVGGKRGLLPAILPCVPKNFGAYFEPFVGGGALFFHLAPRRAILGDSNERLIRTYRGVQDNVERVIQLLRGYPRNQPFFLALRSQQIDARADAEVAAWFIYLNKTGFNGLYRVNRNNEFNVPYGTHLDANTCDEPNLRACARALAGAKLVHADFEAATSGAAAGDFVYFDPPYVPRSTSAKFTEYTAAGFGLAEQERLRDLALRLKRRGVRVLLSNSATERVERLYSRHFELIPVLARRGVNSNVRMRGAVREYLIR